MGLPVRIGMIDHSAESSSTTLYFPAPVDGDLSPIIEPTTGAYDVVKVPFIVLTDLNLTRTVASMVIDTSVGELPSDKKAQRELKLQITYVDNVTTRKYRLEIPGPSEAVIPEGTDVVPLTNPALALFKTAFEAQCVSPVGNPVTVIGARVVGRNR